ncbi:MAG TPA: hypothetical protein DEH78_08225 [Solibacterales bacterium]|nr:hypothetical protein [Bryobacterales bacterium]
MYFDTLSYHRAGGTKTMADPARKRLTREESRAQTRERLMDAAFDLFAREGIEATSIDHIAEAAGYSRGAFYSNFETREEILFAVAERELEKNTAGMRELAALGGTPAERLAHIRRFAIEIPTRHEECQFYLELEAYGMRHPEARARVADFTRRDREASIAYMEALLAEGGVGPEAPSAELMVGSFISLAQGLTMRHIVEGDAFPFSMVEESLKVYFDAVVDRYVRPALERASSTSSNRPSRAGVASTKRTR